MKTKLLILCGTWSLLLLLNSCISAQIIRGSGDLVTEEIPIGNYNKIQVGQASIDVTYTQTDQPAGLSVVTDRNIFDKYIFRVEDGKLEIRPKPEYRYASFQPTRFTVTTRSAGLNKIDKAGSGNFTVDSPLNTENLGIDLAGSGKVYFNETLTANDIDVDVAGSGNLNATDIQARSLDGDIAGSGRMSLAGRIAKVSFDIAGSGSVHAFDLQVEDVDCDIAGSGNVEISVSNSIKLDVAGSGSIKYKGNPQHIKQDIAGSGRIQKVGD